MLVKRFFDNLPREIFEAARSTAPGRSACSGPSCCRCRKPILGVVSVFAVIAVVEGLPLAAARAAEPRPPAAVASSAVQAPTELGVFLAALLISTIVPFVIFLLFQRSFLRGAGLGGAIKG